VTKDCDLEVGLGRRPLLRPDQAEDAAQQEIEERSDHGGALSQIGTLGPRSARSSFCTPGPPAWQADRIPVLRLNLGVLVGPNRSKEVFESGSE